MELYTTTSYELAERFTKRYSTSFAMSSRLFAASMRPHIFAIYSMVRMADEVVDSYRGADAGTQLDRLYDDVRLAMSAGFSPHPLLHAFGVTARQFGIDDDLVRPFFDSMRTDLTAVTFDQPAYEQYIYGSAEVVGLMCLKVFVGGDGPEYERRVEGARALGAAYQKVNFLRDIEADHHQLGRMYFPDVEYERFSEADKQRIICDIEQDFARANTAIAELPIAARRAVRASYYYYCELLHRLQAAPVDVITSRRVRVPNWLKVVLLVRAGIGA